MLRKRRKNQYFEDTKESNHFAEALKCPKSLEFNHRTCGGFWSIFFPAIICIEICLSIRKTNNYSTSLFHCYYTVLCCSMSVGYCWENCLCIHPFIGECLHFGPKPHSVKCVCVKSQRRWLLLQGQCLFNCLVFFKIFFFVSLFHFIYTNNIFSKLYDVLMNKSRQHKWNWNLLWKNTERPYAFILTDNH